MRYQWIDSLKGVGMILVVATHTSLPTIFPRLSLMLTSGYMAMFFILSGYTAKKEPFALAVKKKAKRLLVPYFFYGIVITSMFTMVKGSIDVNEWIGLLYSSCAIYPLNCSENTFLLRMTSPLWFLSAMFMSYVWFYIYVGLKGAVNKCVGVMLYTIATIIFNKIDILLPWSIDTSFLCSMFIIVGYEFSSYATKKYKKCFCYFTIQFFLLLVYIIMVSFNGKANLSVGFYGNHGIISIFLYFVYSIIITILYSEILKSCVNNILAKFLAFVGKYSLRLMCIHLPIIVMTGLLFRKFGVLGQFAIFICAFVFSLAVSVIVGRVVCRYANKYPILKYI